MTDIHFIGKLKFGLLSSEEILKMGVCALDNPKLTGTGSVYDPRMGIIENNLTCSQCGHIKECTGHFGYIKLNHPVIHPLCWKMVLKYLKCFCYKCSMPLITEDMIKLFEFDKLQGEKRLKAIIAKIARINFCNNCSTIQPKYKFVKNDNIIFLVRDK